MKTGVMIFVLLLAIGQLAQADLTVPSSVYDMEQLDQAIQEAVASSKPLVFVYAHPEDSNKDGIDTAEEAFKVFRDVGVVIYANSKIYTRKEFPPGAGQIWSEGGATVPRVYVTTADGSKGLDGMGYGQLKHDMRETARYVKETVDKIDVVQGAIFMTEDADADGAAKESDTPAVEEGPLLAESQDWENVEGKTITAAIRRIEGDVVDFVMPDGRTIAYPIRKLSLDSQARIRTLEAR